MRFDDEDGELSFQVILADFHPDNYVFDANDVELSSWKESQIDDAVRNSLSFAHQMQNRLFNVNTTRCKYSLWTNDAEKDRAIR